MRGELYQLGGIFYTHSFEMQEYAYLPIYAETHKAICTVQMDEHT